MARNSLMILLASWPLAVMAQQPAVDASLVSTPPLAEIKPENFAYVAATRRDRVGRVMAPVFINNVGPFAFLVDTGASSSVIGPRVAARLKLRPAPERTKLLRGITGSERVPTVLVDSLTAGQIALTGRDLPMVEPRVFADADGIFHLYPADHGFNCEERATYDAASAQLARERTLEFLARKLNPPPRPSENE